jgi:hypothetical protein
MTSSSAADLGTDQSVPLLTYRLNRRSNIGHEDYASTRGVQLPVAKGRLGGPWAIQRTNLQAGRYEICSCGAICSAKLANKALLYAAVATSGEGEKNAAL